MPKRNSQTKESAYAVLVGDHVRRSDEVPVDRAMARAPAVRRLRRKMRGLESKVQEQVPDRKAFIRYADLKSKLCDAIAIAHFDEGFVRGEIAGRGELAKARAAGRTLVRSVVDAGLRAGLSPRDVAVALLDTARAFVFGHRARRNSKKVNGR
jgi:hypothetical protein